MTGLFRRRIARDLRALLADAGNRAALLDVIDIGARGGLLDHWARFAPMLRVTAVEPEATEAARLREEILRRSGAADAEVLPVAIADAPGIRPLHLAVSLGATSLLEPNTPWLAEFPESDRWRITRTIQVETTTLDAALATRGGAAFPAFVKIDTQGAEGLILRGVHEALAHTVIGLEIETLFAPVYVGQATFVDVHEPLGRHGFELVDLRLTYWRREVARRVPHTRGQVAFGDALYLLSPSALAHRCGESGVAGEAVATAAVLTCAVYGLDDWLVAYSAAIPDSPILRAAAAVVHGAAGRLSGKRIRGRDRLGNWLKDLGDALLETASTWAPAERRIGGTARGW